MPQRDPKTGRFIKTETPSIEQLVSDPEGWRAMWATWPWTRCTAKLAKGVDDYHGRCDLKKGHRTQHALERGFDVVWFG